MLKRNPRDKGKFAVRKGSDFLPPTASPVQRTISQKEDANTGSSSTIEAAAKQFQYASLREESTRFVAQLQEIFSEREQKLISSLRDVRLALPAVKMIDLGDLVSRNPDYIKFIRRPAGEGMISDGPNSGVKTIERKDSIFSTKTAAHVLHHFYDDNGVFIGMTFMSAKIAPESRNVRVEIMPMIEYKEGQNQGLAFDEVESRISLIQGELAIASEHASPPEYKWPQTGGYEWLASTEIEVDAYINIEDKASFERLLIEGWNAEEIKKDLPRTVHLQKRVLSSENVPSSWFGQATSSAI